MARRGIGCLDGRCTGAGDTAYRTWQSHRLIQTIAGQCAPGQPCFEFAAR